MSGRARPDLSTAPIRDVSEAASRQWFAALLFPGLEIFPRIFLQSSSDKGEDSPEIGH